MPLYASIRYREVGQTWSFRGSTSRNKVSVGEPAEGSLTNQGLCVLELHMLLYMQFSCMIHLCSKFVLGAFKKYS